MIAAASATAGETSPVQGRGRISVVFGLVKNLIIGTLLCLTPVTAVIVLGWTMRYMRAVSLRRLGSHQALARSNGTPAWVLGPRGSGFWTRWFGGFRSNMTIGAGGFVSLALATLPFTGLWLLSWWAGWENSFNKSYEQTWVGRSLGLAGVATGLWVMAHLPMALAHQAMAGRSLALFEIRRVRELIAYAGWRYVVLAAATVVLALPLFAGRGLPTFIEAIIPGFAELSADEIQTIMGRLALAKAGYVFLTLVLLRGWAARIYAHAVMRLVPSNAMHIWADGGIERPDAGRTIAGTSAKRPWLLFRLLQLVLLLGIWFGLVAQIYVGQFLNHNWWYWLNHPYLVLPWTV